MLQTKSHAIFNVIKNARVSLERTRNLGQITREFPNWNCFSTLIPFFCTNLHERTNVFEENNAEWFVCSAVSLGVWDNDVTRGLDVALLGENENAPSRRCEDDKAWPTDVWHEQPPVWLEEKLQKESIDLGADPFSPHILFLWEDRRLEDVSDLLILGIMEVS